MPMTPEALTLVEGANATVEGGTSALVFPSTTGKASGIVPVHIDDSGVATPLVTANGVMVEGETTLADMTVAATNATVNVGDATSSTEVIAANASRKGWVLTNMSSAVAYVKMGTSASATSFHKRLAQYESCGQRIMDGDLYTGAIHALWASDAGGTIVGGDW